MFFLSEKWKTYLKKMLKSPGCFFTILDASKAQSKVIINGNDGDDQILGGSAGDELSRVSGEDVMVASCTKPNGNISLVWL